VRVYPSDRPRYLVLRAAPGDEVPAAIIAALAENRATYGCLRGSGLLSDVELRAFDAQAGRPGSTRRLAGPIQAVSVESSIGLAGGRPSIAMRAVLARETDRGLETIAGEIANARALALEVFVVLMDDLAFSRAVDPATGIELFADAPATAAAPATWNTAVEASVRTERDMPAHAVPLPASVAPASRAATVQMPTRPARPGVDLDAVVPEPGDIVDHFAFGRCDVLKSDGDRLHLRVHKDGRIREIALEMLRVTPLSDEGADGLAPGLAPDAPGGDRHPRRFRLERKL
jgi:predicted DNA-binding protein with PD1-like motif